MTRSVWIVNPYGTLPGESWAEYRSTMLATRLADAGFQVTQFISNFEHRSKVFRANGHQVRELADGYRVEIIPASSYQSHVSIRRIRYERSFARHLLQAVASRPTPDAIVLAEPALFYYDVLMPLLTNPQVRLVLDVIDIWPELLELVIPRPARRFSRGILGPLFAWRKRLYRRADAVVAVSRDYLDIARRQLAGRSVPGAVVYWGWTEPPQEVECASERAPALTELLATKQPDDVWVVYAGTLGENYDIPAIVTLSRALESANRSVRVIVCGDGPLADYCARHAGGQLTFLGRLTPWELRRLYECCDLALCTYKGASTVAMPIKAFDYLRFGLPMVNSLGRDLGALVRDREVGVNYEPEVPGSLASAVLALTTDHQLRQRMARNARLLAGEFSAARQYEVFVRLLRELLGPAEPSVRSPGAAR